MSSINRHILSVTIVSALAALSSCGGHKAEPATDIAEDTLINVVEEVPINEDDKIDETNSTTVKPQEMGIPSRRFSNKEEALQFMKSSPQWDRYSTGILIQMLDDNFPYADRLLNNTYDYFIVADKQSMHVCLFDRFGNLVKSYPMACARNFGTKHKRNDCRTPEGFFYAQGVYDSTDWLYTDENGYTSPTRGVYGPRFIRVKADVTSSVGIHGTGSPGSIGHRVSHGCIRVNNESIMDLVKYAKAGMPLIVNPSDRDVAVNRSEGYNILQIHTGLQSATTSRDVSGEVNQEYPAAPLVHPETPDTTGLSVHAGEENPVELPVEEEPATMVPDTAAIVK